MSRINNFDLVRFLAASQVLVWHAAAQLDYFYPIYGFLRVLFHIPGVPIFFALSGFLLSYSVHNKVFDWKKYSKNRILRIYPALYVCTLLTGATMLFFLPNVGISTWAIWLVSQLTFLQPFVPTDLKAYGVGHPNGSLWSIAVELQYYVVLPLIWWVIGSWKRLAQNGALLVLGLSSIGFRFWVENALAPESMIWKALTVSLPYHLYFFIFGMIVYVNWSAWRMYLEEKVGLWILLYATYVLIGAEWFGWYQNPYDYHLPGLIANSLLVAVVFSAAFSAIHVSEKLLRGNDISYGLYIYHMPIVNVFVMYHAKGALLWVILTLILSTVFAWLSWRFVEKPFLRLK